MAFELAVPVAQQHPAVQNKTATTTCSSNLPISNCFTLHVAVLFEFPSLNGGEHSMLAVLDRLNTDASIRFTAIAPSQGPLAERLRSLDIPIVPFIVRAYGGVKRDADQLTTELESIVSALQPDVLHANSLSMSRLTGQVRPLPESVCCTGHIRDIMKLSAKAMSDLNRLDRIATVSEATKTFHETRGLRPDIAHVIYNGVDTDRFRRRSRTDARRVVLPQIPRSSRVLLNVGQICLRKGQLDLARAVVQLLNTRDDIHLVLIGERHSEKEETAAYEQAIFDMFASADRSGHLHRAGYQENVEQWMNAADLLVHTAHQEPLGRVLLEAAACELPVIATAVGGTPEILEDQRAARLLPAGDIDALKSCLMLALDNPSQGRSFAAVAVTRIKQVFGITRTCHALQEFWNMALRSK